MPTTMHGNELRCLHCGEMYAMNLPAPIGVVTAAMRAWDELHGGCDQTESGLARFKFTTPEEWKRSWDTGESSLTIWYFMMKDTHSTPQRTAAVPRDPSDFGRCYRLLKAFPEWRVRLPALAAVHPEWAPYVDAWTLLEALFEEEEPSGQAPKLYATMKEIGKVAIPRPTEQQRGYLDD